MLSARLEFARVQQRPAEIFEGPAAVGTRFEMPGPAGPVQAGLRLGTGGRLTAVLLSPDRRQHDAMLQAV